MFVVIAHAYACIVTVVSYRISLGLALKCLYSVLHSLAVRPFIVLWRVQCKVLSLNYLYQQPFLYVYSS